MHDFFFFFSLSSDPGENFSFGSRAGKEKKKSLGIPAMLSLCFDLDNGRMQNAFIVTDRQFTTKCRVLLHYGA